MAAVFYSDFEFLSVCATIFIYSFINSFPTMSSKKLPDWLTHNYKIPKPNYRLLAWAVAFVLIPNLFFIIGAYFVGVSRPLINIDYFVACVLFVMPHRFFRLSAMLVFIFTMLLDVIMMAMQLFPFLDIFAAISLAPFLTNAPFRYMVLVGIAGIYIFSMPFLMRRLAQRFYSVKLGWLYVFFVSVVGWFAYDKFNEIKYVNAHGERFAQSDYFVIHSQYKRYRWVADSEFVEHFGKVPQMITIDIPYISHHFGVQKSGITEPESRPLVTAENSSQVTGDKGVEIGDVPRNLSNKMLLIVAESWGVARDSNAQKDILAGVYAHRDKFEFLDTGYFGFSGATVEGELRELCQLDVEGGYGFKKLDSTPFKNCLPHRLNAQGYKTIGMHTGFSSIYERGFLYPNMGFKKTIFAEQYNNRKRCSPFNGICDSEMFDVLEQEFASSDKIFFYWLTLTSHSPFSKKDITNPRFDCDKYAIPAGDICNNFRLQAQFFDGLGELLAKPEIKGVEVIVVGDHMPPIISRESIHPYIQWQDVSWIHFKIKE